MTENNQENNEILKALGLENVDAETLSFSHGRDGSTELSIRLKCVEHECPVCLSKTKKIKGYTKKKITHSVLNTTPCYIMYEARRFQCPRCHKTFYEFNPFVHEGSRISATTVYKVLLDLKIPSATFTDVAARYHISSTSCSSIFDKHVFITRRALPECLSLDEVAAFRSSNGKFVCVLYDYTNRKIVDLLPSRLKYDLINYFSRIPLEERKKVKVCSFDMWETYRIVCGMMFPEAALACDRFHVQKEMNRQCDSIRIKVMKRQKNIVDHYRNKRKHTELTVEETGILKKAEQNYYLLKKFNWLLFSNDKKITDPNVEKKYNRALERYVNYYDLHDMIVEIDKDIEEVNNLHYQLYQFYTKSTFETARENIEELISDLSSSSIEEMRHFSNTLIRWKREICNSFIIVSKVTAKKGETINRRISNSDIENTNRVIKLIKHSSNGYLNWNRFRNRVLYSINSDSTFHLYPRKKEKDEYMYINKD